MPSVVDATGTTVALDGPPARVVSLVPSLSETLYAFGLADRIVGVTTYCVTPEDGFPAARRVRGTKNPDVNAIAALEPDLVVANLEENRELDVRRLREAGCTVHVTFPRTVAAAADAIRELGALVGVADAGEQLAREIEATVLEVQRSRRSAVRTFCPIWREPWMALGGDTYAADLLATCGFATVPENATRYPQVELADVADADVVLLPSEPYAFGEQHLADFAGWDVEVRLVDGALLTWYGPRTPAALRSFARSAA